MCIKERNISYRENIPNLLPFSSQEKRLGDEFRDITSCKNLTPRQSSF
jgi:hypothetical protein